MISLQVQYVKFKQKHLLHSSSFTPVYNFPFVANCILASELCHSFQILDHWNASRAAVTI